MKSVATIATNELRRLFLSPLAWIILATVQFLLAIFFYLLLSKYMQPAPWHADRGLTAIVAIGLFQIAGIVLLLITPFMTMRLFSDELRSGTIKLLLSSPLSVTELVLGKYFGIMLFFLLLVTLVTLMPLSLQLGTRLDAGLLLSAVAGLTLLCSAFAAIGLFLSSLSNSPAIAAVSTFIVTFLLWIIHVANDPAGEQLQAVTSYLSLQKHFNMLLSGYISSVDVAYFLLLSALFILLSIWRLDAIRTHQ